MACEAKGCTGRWQEGQDQPPRFDIDRPATAGEVEAMERQIGRPLPAAFRRVLLDVARAVRVEWQLPEEVSPPEDFGDIFAGECLWDLKEVPALLDHHQSWIDSFDEATGWPADWWNAKWHKTFPVLDVGTGDQIAIDLDHARTGGGEPVVYLSHDGDDTLRGAELGASFEDYIDRLTRLGCVGSEGWQLEVFIH